MAGEGSRTTQFKPGQSGNPKGRPLGSRSKRSVALDALSEASAEAIVLALIDMAKDGDVSAARAILGRVWPVRKGAKVAFELPGIARADELPGAIAGVIRQVAEANLTLEEGVLVVGLLEVQRKALETADLAARLAALEARSGTW